MTEPYQRATSSLRKWLLPPLYLHGLSSGDLVPAMEQFLGSAAGLSPATVTRLTKQWSDDHAAFQERDLSGSNYVDVWADGVHRKVRLGQARSCVLVLIPYPERAEPDCQSGSIDGPLLWPSDERWPECSLPDENSPAGLPATVMVLVAQIFRRDAPGPWWACRHRPLAEALVSERALESSGSEGRRQP